MRCGICRTPVDPEDNYCRHCGASLNHRSLPTIVSHSPLPVPWVPARKQVVQSVAAVALGTVAELLRRRMLRAVATPNPGGALSVLGEDIPVNGKRGRLPWSRAPKGEYEVTETLIERRVRFFRR